MSYKKAIYFIPVKLEDFNQFVLCLSNDNRWEPTAQEKFTPRYLLSYAVRIAKNPNFFRAFDLKKQYIPKIYMFEKELNLSSVPTIEQIRFSLFSTGVAFMEFWVDFNDLNVEEIADFSYRFKKATSKFKSKNDGFVNLYDGAMALLPKDSFVELFFTASVPFKYECMVFHFIQLATDCDNDKECERRLSLLKRNYSTKFDIANESEYDMIYKPYFNDHWAGSTEGIVNISYDLDPQQDNYYLHVIKETHLRIDYYFMYLLLLNQRFSSIHYITEISECTDIENKEIEFINKKAVRLKTTFSFRIISDDQIFQNVYSKMYKILEIHSLLEDIRDNESQIELINNLNSTKAEKRSSQFLMGLSLLSLFSALIDASCYFDRLSVLEPIATFLGTICTVLVMLLCGLWLYKNRNKI